MKYRWLLFDADNTLFDFDRSERYALEKALGGIGVAFDQEYLDTYHKINRACWRAFEDGRLPKSQLRTKRFEDYFSAIGVEADPVRFSEDYLHQLSTTDFMLEGARSLLDDLTGQYKLAIITNGLKEVQRPRIAKAGLMDRFDVIVVSDEIGHSKPHPAFFDYAFGEMQQPEKAGVLVVGDNLNSDIKGGINYGLDTCWYNHFGEENQSEVRPTYEVAQISAVREVLTGGSF